MVVHRKHSENKMCKLKNFFFHERSSLHIIVQRIASMGLHKQNTTKRNLKKNFPKKFVMTKNYPKGGFIGSTQETY